MFRRNYFASPKPLYTKESGESGVIEKQEVEKNALSEFGLLQRDVLFTQITGTLKNKLGGLSISLDLKPFEEKLRKNLDEILLSDKIPFIAKRKFIDDVKMKVEKYFSAITTRDIADLREIRNSYSLGVSEYELRGKTENEIQTIHLNMILSANLMTYIAGSGLGLKEAFLAESEKQNGGEYSKKGLDEYAKMISEVDTRYGLSMSNIAKESKERASKAGVDLMSAGLFLDMRLALITELAKKDPEFAKKQTNLISTLSYNPSFNIQYNLSMTVKLGSKSYLLRDIVNDYAKVNGTWHQKEHEVSDARATAIADNLLSKTKKVFGTEQLRSEFDKLSDGDMENIVKNSSLADTIIMVTQVTQIFPALGDVIGGVMDTSDSVNGINAKGEKFTRMERIGSGILGGLSIVIVGGLINRARKGPKYAKMLELLTKHLPTIIEKYQKMGGGLTKDMKEKILKFTRDIGATTLGQRMQEIFESNYAIRFTEPQKRFAGEIHTPQLNERFGKTSGDGIGVKVAQDKGGNYMPLRINLPPIGSEVKIRRTGGRVSSVIVKGYINDEIIFEENGRKFTKSIDDIVPNGKGNTGGIDSVGIMKIAGKSDIRETQIRLFREKFNNLLPQQRQLINELYGGVEGIFQQSRQGNIGNCYFLAGIDSLKYTPDFIDIITKVLKKTPEGWEVTFLGLKPPLNKTLVTQSDLSKTEAYFNGKMIQLFSDSSLADRILERAHWRLRHNNVGQTGSKNQSIPYQGSRQTVVVYAGEDGTQATTHTGGRSDTVISQLFGYNTQSIKLWHSGKKAGIKHDALRKVLQEKGTLTIGTKINGNDQKTFTVMTHDGPRVLNYSHEYSGYYNQIDDTITVVNPHNTKEKRHIFSLEDFLNNGNFNEIFIGRLNHLNQGSNSQNHGNFGNNIPSITTAPNIVLGAGVTVGMTALGGTIAMPFITSDKKNNEKNAEVLPPKKVVMISQSDSKISKVSSTDSPPQMFIDIVNKN